MGEITAWGKSPSRWKQTRFWERSTQRFSVFTVFFFQK